MTHIQFSKEQLADKTVSFNREILLTNRKGAYSSTTISGCNTRKYHGLLVAPQPQFDLNKFVFLSSLDETIVYSGKTIQFGTHQYEQLVFPEGYEHLTDFKLRQFPTWEMQADGFHISKELIMARDSHRIFIVYNILKAPVANFEMNFYPMTAFRNTHTLCRSNHEIDKKTYQVENGIRMKLYPGFDNLYIQTSRKSEFIQNPDWYYHVVYNQEKERGYNHSEDLYCPGFIRLKMKRGDKLILFAGLEEASVPKLRGLLNEEYKNMPPMQNFRTYLEHAGEQFIISENHRSGITAGFPWFGQWSRDTLISLPGLTLVNTRWHLFKSIVNTLMKDLKNGLFPNCGYGADASYNTADASLWFFWALQQYALYTGNISQIWKEYGPKMKSILKYLYEGTDFHIHMDNNGLLYAGDPGHALTWMDAVVDGKPVTPRTGYAVELNALWYNAICFTLEAAKAGNDQMFQKSWSVLPPQIEKAFTEMFWIPELGYLADHISVNHIDYSLRPNQIFALSLPYSPVSREIGFSILNSVKEKLLTPRGLRTLSPDEAAYHGQYNGDQKSRDNAYHQGTVWPWLLGHYTEAVLKMEGEKALPELRLLLEGFSQTLDEYGLGCIAEVYDGDSPHKPGACISQAWSVAELLRMQYLIDTYKTKVQTKDIQEAKISLQYEQ